MTINVRRQPIPRLYRVRDTLALPYHQP